ncbi:hypothetical protein ABT294_06780 [Nonomuraea sp. NPDC000554]|uniref:hypothetical protein n=1 Tax=Nonomuraea sp. NPDC000554 TaxID=3154259 RepID=UPI00331B25EB
MRGDARRLAVLMNELAASGQRLDRARACAITTFVTKLCAGIHHHRAEDGA